ncbi:type IX secretion system membrane protein, PorP/SprF family [Catalinimonas alkaloidigena]|uniref:Type IX secretion system membrane protein, PorP/SprF family n=1 Tax=Catalinimonas alkaloidigena TaxID=1075417 RepID=A0A1G9GY74_9BACT|nr:PorP/SprF family type IX secretion system membrane protein [Catalinimonas alkaloidigena]SDL05545.1 type IX secretion system membrane protein, PorP/SprF family [Catalinimonas alkaloidigena]
MNRTLTRYYVFFTLLLTISSLRAQDAQFSQFYASSLYLNPALAGLEQDLTFSANYRSQWQSIVVPYLTNQVSVIAPLWRERIEPVHVGGIGFSVFNDRAGDGNLNTTGVNMTFAYDLLARNQGMALVVAGQGGLVQRSLDMTNTEWGEQFNPFIGFDPSVPVNISMLNSRRTFADVAAGLMWAYNPLREAVRSPVSFYAGVAGSHLNSPDESMRQGFSSSLPILLKAHTGADFRVSDKLHLSPNLLWMQQSELQQLNGGVYLRYQVVPHPFGLLGESEFMLGGWYRYGDAFIINTGLSTPAFTVGFSYDVNSSGLRYNTKGRGAYELSLTIRNFKEHRRKRFSTPRI